MHCDERVRAGRRAAGFAAVAAAVLIGCTACSLFRRDAAPPPTEPAPVAGSAKPAPSVTMPGATTVPTAKGLVRLPPPETPRDWSAARRQAAHRLVAANPDATYMGKPPDILLAIPVLTIELQSDGSIRRITVMRYPSQARDTVQLAMAAVRRAAPFGDVSKLPKPWKFNETFLFNDARKFKPMTLNQP